MIHGWLNEAATLALGNEWYLGDENSRFAVDVWFHTAKLIVIQKARIIITPVGQLWKASVVTWAKISM